MKYLNRKCFICGKSVGNGIIINGHIICNKCEKEISQINIISSKYESYVQRIREILFN